jgi:hypothetical protein
MKLFKLEKCMREVTISRYVVVSIAGFIAPGLLDDDRDLGRNEAFASHDLVKVETFGSHDLGRDGALSSQEVNKFFYFTALSGRQCMKIY